MQQGAKVQDSRVGRLGALGVLLALPQQLDRHGSTLLLLLDGLLHGLAHRRVYLLSLLGPLGLFLCRLLSCLFLSLLSLCRACLMTLLQGTLPGHPPSPQLPAVPACLHAMCMLYDVSMALRTDVVAETL